MSIVNVSEKGNVNVRGVNVLLFVVKSAFQESVRNIKYRVILEIISREITERLLKRDDSATVIEDRD